MSPSPEHWWYSPQSMLLFADDALIHCQQHERKAPPKLDTVIGETRAGAIFALGLAKALNTETWMRLVDPTEHAPDLRVMYLDATGPRRSNRMNVVEVEVASYTRFSTESLGDFIFRTKLDPTKKAYSSQTALIIYVQRSTKSEDIGAAHHKLVELKPRGLCYLIGQLDSDRFQVVRVYPTLGGPQTVSLNAAFAREQRPVAQLKRGMSPAVQVSDQPVPTPNPILDYI